MGIKNEYKQYVNHELPDVQAGHGNPLSILAWRISLPMDRGAWWATVHRVSKSDRNEATEHTPMLHFVSYFPINL